MYVTIFRNKGVLAVFDAGGSLAAAKKAARYCARNLPSSVAVKTAVKLWNGKLKTLPQETIRGKK